MSAKELLDIAQDVLAAIEADLLDAQGHLAVTYKGVGELVSAVEASYVKRTGAVINPTVSAIIAGVVAVLSVMK